ncbi:elastin-like [Balaenoptera acutorostrata]|uniref:Elastin-like n=1 Tax=Balaenoptera acutorostrata TaxID=9767 RepID=A0ABM3T2U1_BALAC|nr:elastin-like [Balaenoptera acutorostrata]
MEDASPVSDRIPDYWTKKPKFGSWLCHFNCVTLDGSHNLFELQFLQLKRPSTPGSVGGGETKGAGAGRGEGEKAGSAAKAEAGNSAQGELGDRADLDPAPGTEYPRTSGFPSLGPNFLLGETSRERSPGWIESPAAVVRGGGRGAPLPPLGPCFPAGTAPSRVLRPRVGQCACPGRGAGLERGAGAGDGVAESAVRPPALPEAAEAARAAAVVVAVAVTGAGAQRAEETERRHSRALCPNPGPYPISENCELRTKKPASSRRTFGRGMLPAGPCLPLGTSVSFSGKTRQKPGAQAWS